MFTWFPLCFYPMLPWYKSEIQIKWMRFKLNESQPLMLHLFGMSQISPIFTLCYHFITFSPLLILLLLIVISLSFRFSFLFPDICIWDLYLFIFFFIHKLLCSYMVFALGLLQALDNFNTAIVSPIYYAMFTSFTIFASAIMFKVFLSNDHNDDCVFMII